MTEAVLRALELSAIVIGWLSVGLLVAAAVVHVRRTVDTPPPPVGRRARAAQAVVVLPTLVAVISALALDVPLAYGWGTVLAVALLLVLLRRDERFWAALALLFPIYLVTGLVLMIALSHNYVDVGGDRLWYGGRQLEAWGGLHANPSYAHWEWTVVALAITRYALPLSLIVATTWVASVRGAMTRIERLGLVTASQSLLAAVAIGATFSVVVLGAGLLSGVSPLLVVVGVVGSLFTLLTVGPGAVGGVIVEGRTLGRRVPAPAQGAYTLATSLRDAHDATQDPEALDAGLSVPRSLVGFLSGDVTGLRRLNLIALAVFGGFVALSLAGAAISGQVPDNRAVHFEYITEEQGVGFVVDDAVRVSDDTVWLVGNGRLALFEPKTGALRHSTLRPSGAAVEDGRLLLLTGDGASTLVAVDPEHPDDGEAIVRLERHAAGRLAVNTDGVYVLGASGRVRRFDRHTGEQTAESALEYADEEPVALVAEDDAVWTVQGDRSDRRIVRRDPRSLESVSRFDSRFGEVDVLTDDDPDARLLELVLDEELVVAENAPWQRRSRTFLDDHGRPRWRSSGLGTLHRLRGGEEAERWDFHYDSINGVFEAGDTTWLLVDDDQGTIIDETADRETVLARWEGRTT